MNNYRLPSKCTMIGQTINGYKITDEIGKGGMAIVYKGENNDTLTKNRAFKVVRPDIGENNHQLYNRFLNEINIMGGLREHPNIVKAEDVHQHQNTTILEMEYLNGMNQMPFIATVVDLILRKNWSRRPKRKPAKPTKGLMILQTTFVMNVASH